MKFFRLDLLTLLISLFILNSCKNQDTAGLGISASGQANGALVDTSTIVTNTVLEDSVITSSLSKNALGYFVDPLFGTTEANIATNLNLPGSASFALPSGQIVIDSARLVMQYADGFYGDSIESSYKVNVYQLNEKFVTGSSYYATKQWDYNSSNVLGSLTFNARTHDSIKIFNIITGAPDTLIRVRPQLRIPINPSFINNNFFAASSTTLGNNTTFNAAIKGLYITLDKTKISGVGGVFMFQPTDTLAVYYRTINGTTIDTTSAFLPITSLAVQIKHTYTAAIQTELNNTSTSRPIFYVQGLSSLRAKISFPYFLQNLRNGLLQRDSDIVINRAELVITPTPGSSVPFSPLPKITMYKLDIAHQRSYLPDALTSAADARAQGASVFGGFYSPSKQNYHFVITAYLQDLLDNKTIDYGTYISPIDTVNTSSTTSVDISNNPQVAARLAAVGGSNKSAPYAIKLNVIYTKIKK